MRALITGITGQDGSYLAEHLAAEGHEVSGLVRSAIHSRREWLERLLPDVDLHVGDMLDQTSLDRVLRDVRPDEVYNLAAVTSPGADWSSLTPPMIAEVTGVGVVHLLEATWAAVPDARVVHASSSAIYDVPRYGIYGAAKRLAHDAVAGNREARGRHVSNAVLYSHTSPRQSNRFLIRRIARHAARVAEGRSSDLVLTNVANERDWGYAPDYVRALPLIARSDDPADYVVRTGERHSVRHVVEIACLAAGVTWREVAAGWHSLSLVADGREARGWDPDVRELGWRPGTSFGEMIEILVAYERDLL